MWLDFGTFEYKVRDGLIAFPEYFDLPEEYYRKGCFSTASVRTSDNRYVVAELSGKSMNRNTLELIGGVMETNIAFKSWQDVFRSFYEELEEEAGINREDITQCYLRAIYVEARTNVGFYFEVLSNLGSAELQRRFGENTDEDIKALHMFTREEYIKTLEQHPSSNKPFLAKFLQI